MSKPLDFQFNLSQVDKIKSYLSQAGQGSKVDVKNVSGNSPLPPASFQRFLRTKKSKVAGVVLADHEKEFKNK